MVECFKRLAIGTSIGSILQAKASVWFLPGFVCMDYSSYWYRYYLYGYLQVSEQLLNVLFLPGISRGRNRYYMYGYLQVSQYYFHCFFQVSEQVLNVFLLPGISRGRNRYYMYGYLQVWEPTTRSSWSSLGELSRIRNQTLTRLNTIT